MTVCSFEHFSTNNFVLLKRIYTFANRTKNLILYEAMADISSAAVALRLSGRPDAV
jgi:hypothetical protein